MNLQEYLKQEGRGALARLSKKISVKPPIVSFWASGQRQVPAERCPEIERITNGQVTCEELRPDVNWAVLRNSGK